MLAPSLAAALEGQNLKLLGKHQLKSLRASATLGSGQGAADPLVSDVEISSYASGNLRIAGARLQTSGTRGAHSLRLTARGENFDALAEVHGGWNAGAWTGMVDKLQNAGRYALALQAPAPLRHRRRARQRRDRPGEAAAAGAVECGDQAARGQRHLAVAGQIRRALEQQGHGRRRAAELSRASSRKGCATTWRAT